MDDELVVDVVVVDDELEVDDVLVVDVVDELVVVVDDELMVVVDYALVDDGLGNICHSCWDGIDKVFCST